MATSTEFLNKAVLKKQGSLAFAWLADRELEAGNVLVATEILDEGLARFPESVPGLFIKAKILCQQQKQEDASHLLVEILERDPLHLAAQKTLAQVFIGLSRGPEAHALVAKLRELDSLAQDFPVIPESLYAFTPESGPVISSAPTEFLIEREQLFASLEDAFLEETVAGDEKSAAELQTELEAALASTQHVETEQEYFPADDSTLPSGEVSSLFSQMFGKEETKSESETIGVPEPETVVQVEPEPELESVQEATPSVASASIFSSYTPPPPPPPAPEPEPVATVSAPTQESPIAARNPSGVDLASALNDLFGDDDDELPIENMGASVIPSVPQVSPTSGNARSVQEGFQGGISDALGEMFGTEDELPKEGFESSPSSAIFEKTPEVASTPANDLSGGVADALGDMFGLEDELPVEGQESLGPVSDESVQEVEESEISSALFEKTPEVSSTPANELTGGVADALTDMFGLEEDLPLEEQEPANHVLEEAVEEVGESESETLSFEKTPEVSNSSAKDLTDGVADALGNMFGLEEDLPEEGVIPLESLDESSTVVHPVTESVEETIENPVDELSNGVSDALGSMFGSEDDLPDEGSRGATTMEELLGGTPEPLSDGNTSSEMIGLQSLADSIYDETPSAPQPESAPDREFRDGVASALGGLFGELEDESLRLDSTTRPVQEAKNDSPFADLLAGDEEAHDEGAVLTGDLAQSLIADPTAPVIETEVTTPAQTVSKSEDDSFSGGMSNALTDLFGAELDEDLSDLMEEKKDAASQGSTWTLGELYLEQGHVAEALQVFQELLVADPANEALRQKIAEVQQRVAQEGSSAS